MDRRSYIEGVGAAVLTGALAGCTGNETDDSGGSDGSDDDTTNGDDGGDETTYGVLSTSITDQPNDIGDFEELLITIQGIWVKPAGSDEGDGSEDEDTEEDSEEEDGNGDNETENEEEAEQNEDGADDADEESDDDADEEPDDVDVDESAGRRYIEFEEAQEADLVQLQGDNSQLIDETEIETGDYQFLQLDVSETNGILVESDEEPDVETPGNAPLQFKESFEIRAEERTRFIADFAPFRVGQGSRYLIRPVASGTRVIYDDESDETDETEDTDDETEDGEADDGSGTETGDEDGDTAQNDTDGNED